MPTSDPALRVTFWGVRGSIATPGRRTLKTGGNTSCVGVDAGDRLLILDAGSGLRELGLSWGRRPMQATILLSHYHWDHLLGFPGFGPMFDPKSHFAIYGEGKDSGDARAALERQFAAPHFPVPFEDIAAGLAFHPVVPGDRFDLDDVSVTVGRLHHPNDAVCYRIERGGRSMVYATDHEHDDDERHRELEEFARGADLLIYDSTYDESEYERFRGWGHSTWQEAIALGERAGVGQVAIFHHDPDRDDRAVDDIERRAKARSSLATIAREGLVIELDGLAPTDA